MNLCRHCKVNEGTTCDWSHHDKTSGKTRRYFSCKQCNATRARKYRQTPNGKDVYRGMMQRQYIKNHEKVLARIKLNYHLRKKNISKPQGCSKCGFNVKIEAHHTDYKKPLDVIWLCRDCHSTV